MCATEHLIVILCLVSGHEAGILNRMLEYWQPNNVYVILNSSTTGAEDVIAAMALPRFVSTRGDFANFIPQNPIRSVFPDNFVLVLFTDDSCRSVIPILRDQLSQGIIVKRSKIVVSAEMVKAASAEVLFRGLWNMGLLNVFILDDSYIFGFNPFTNDFLIQYPATKYLRLISVDRAGNLHGAQLYVPQIETYPQAQTITRRNRTIQVGAHFYAQRPLAKFFNATVCLYEPKVVDFGFEFFHNATSSIVHPGIGRELAEGHGNLTLMARVYARSNYFDFLMPQHFRDCSLLIPKSGKVSQYTVVASLASSWVGIFSIVTLVSIGIFTAIMKRLLQAQVEITRFIFELGSVLIGQSFSFPIRTMSMRITIICWLIACISLASLFNAEIVMSFLTPMFVQDLDYPFDAIQANSFNVYTFDDFVYYLRGNSKQLFSSDKVFQLLLKRLRPVPREEFFDRVLHPNGKDMFMVIAMADNLVEKTKYLTEQTYSYHKTKPFFISLTATIVPRGSIIYNHYNEFQYRVFEAGLLYHWKRLELFYEMRFGSGNEAQEKSLTIEDLYSAFMVLVLGYALAVIVFATEMLGAHFRRKVF